jgi:hypothetical protein
MGGEVYPATRSHNRRPPLSPPIPPHASNRQHLSQPPTAAPLLNQTRYVIYGEDGWRDATLRALDGMETYNDDARHAFTWVDGIWSCRRVDVEFQGLLRG